jgi:beta-phosphoglucomutase family hydrolase
MSNNKLEAVLWDLDGVIADTGIYHYQAWVDVFDKLGKTFTEAQFMHYFGQRHDTIIHGVLGEVTQEEFDAITEEKQENYRQRVARNIQPMPGAIELIKSLGKNGIKTAIASSAPPENVDIIVKGLGIQNCFDAYARGTEVAEGKPSPLVFLLAAEKLAVEPAGCVVIEDAIAGVAAAKSAGMKCIAVTNSHPRDKLEQADLVVDTLDDVSISDLKKLFETE